MPDWLALLIVIGIGVFIVLLVVALAGASLTEFYARVPEYQQGLEAQRQRLVEWLERYSVNVSEVADQEGLDPQGLFELARTVLGTLGSLSGNVVLVLLMFIFLLVEASGLCVKLQAIPGYAVSDDERLRQILADIRHYLAIKTQTSLLTGFLVALWLWILGVDFPILWGLLAFFFNFVPNIGSVIAAIPAVVLARFNWGPSAALAAAASYLVINGLIGYILEPRLMGRGLGLSTLVVFLSLIFWGWVSWPCWHVVVGATDHDRQNRFGGYRRNAVDRHPPRLPSTGERGQGQVPGRVNPRQLRVARRSAALETIASTAIIERIHRTACGTTLESHVVLG